MPRIKIKINKEATKFEFCINEKCIVYSTKIYYFYFRVQHYGKHEHLWKNVS